MGKKEEKTLCLRAFSSSLYKDTTFFCEIQMTLTFRNNLSNVKMQRFAAARFCYVLYYEARSESWIRQRVRDAQLRNTHGFRQNEQD